MADGNDPFNEFASAIPSEKQFFDLWKAAAAERGADPAKLIKSQLDGMLATAKQVVLATGGDTREQHRLEAMFALGKFNAEAEAFLEIDAWTGALLDVLKSLGKTLLEAGAKALVAGLASSLQNGLA